ncbi:hypothetical protein E4U41_000967, partial [Claviceps citrina]
LDETTLVGAHISSDENDCLTFGNDPITGEPSRVPQIGRDLVSFPQISSIKYHEPTHKVLVTAREVAGESYQLAYFSPVFEEDGEGERWFLKETR